MSIGTCTKSSKSLLLKSREFTRWFLLWFLSCFCSKFVFTIHCGSTGINLGSTEISQEPLSKIHVQPGFQFQVQPRFYRDFFVECRFNRDLRSRPESAKCDLWGL